MGANRREGAAALLRKVVGMGFLVQGFRCFPWLGVSYFLIDGLGVAASSLQILQNSANLPMVAKPLIGILSDAISINGQHRLPYVAIGGMMVWKASVGKSKGYTLEEAEERGAEIALEEGREVPPAGSSEAQNIGDLPSPRPSMVGASIRSKERPPRPEDSRRAGKRPTTQSAEKHAQSAKRPHSTGPADRTRTPQRPSTGETRSSGLAPAHPSPPTEMWRRRSAERSSPTPAGDSERVAPAGGSRLGPVAPCKVRLDGRPANAWREAREQLHYCLDKQTLDFLAAKAVEAWCGTTEVLSRGLRLLRKNEELQARVSELENLEAPPSEVVQGELERMHHEFQLQASRMSQMENEKQAADSQLEESQAQRASLEEELSRARSAQQEAEAHLESAMSKLSLRSESVDQLKDALAKEKDARAQYEAGEEER